jgi:hypothetical protein
LKPDASSEGLNVSWGRLRLEVSSPSVMPLSLFLIL